MKSSLSISLVCVGSLLIVCGWSSVEGQLLDRLLNPRNEDPNSNLNAPPEQQPVGAVVRKMMNALSVNVPLFYDMTKNGTSMGINVLSGLVRVDRGREAERSGLVGPRPLSVRVFGVPVYERGTRVANPPEQEMPSVSSGGSGGNGIEMPAKPEDDEELPIET